MTHPKPTNENSHVSIKVAAGKILKAARKRRRLTQRTMAKRVGMTQPNYSKIERGEVAFDFVVFSHLCQALHMTDTEVGEFLHLVRVKPSDKEIRHDDPMSFETAHHLARDYADRSDYDRASYYVDRMASLASTHEQTAKANVFRASLAAQIGAFVMASDLYAKADAYALQHGICGLPLLLIRSGRGDVAIETGDYWMAHAIADRLIADIGAEGPSVTLAYAYLLRGRAFVMQRMMNEARDALVTSRDTYVTLVRKTDRTDLVNMAAHAEIWRCAAALDNEDLRDAALESLRVNIKTWGPDKNGETSDEENYTLASWLLAEATNDDSGKNEINKHIERKELRRTARTMKNLATSLALRTAGLLLVVVALAATVARPALATNVVKPPTRVEQEDQLRVIDTFKELDMYKGNFG